MDKLTEVENNSWFVWSKHVLLELENHAKCLSEIKKDQTEIKKDLAALKVKAQVWGLVGGAIPVAITIVIGLIYWLAGKSP